MWGKKGDRGYFEIILLSGAENIVHPISNQNPK